MALLMRQISIGLVQGTMYTFEKKGDLFLVHTHLTEADNHLTFVMFGAIECLSELMADGTMPSHHGKIVRAAPGGTVIKWKVGEAHGFRADEDGTSIFNQKYFKS